MKIQQSKVYEMFELHEINRDVVRAKELEESFKKHGWIDAYPLHVIKSDGGRYKIKAGHHRASVAMRLGIPYKFVVCEDSATIHELEGATRNWNMRDYMNSWERAGNDDYAVVKSYCARTGIGVSLAISMLGGHLASSRNFSSQFKSGTYRVRSFEHADAVADVVLFAKALGLDGYNGSYFVQALSRVLLVEKFDVEMFKRKLKKYKSLFSRKRNVQETVAMIEEIYNRQSKSRIPLAFEADEVARARDAARGTTSACGARP